MDTTGTVKVLKQRIPLTEGEVVDCAVMNVTALRRFYAEQIAAAKADNALFSLHLKCTMMKVSDPIMFGHCVAEYFADALRKHAGVLAEIGANVNNGLADVLSKLDQLPAGKKAEIEADIAACYEGRPGLAMVDSRAGRTNLHVPSDVIVDASIPVVIRDGGKMWNKEDQLQDTVAVIPDRCYATMYQVVIEDCQKNGQFDPATMGSVSNVGLMAQKAEEYGSHDKTFVAPGNGTIRIIENPGGKTLLEQTRRGRRYLSRLPDERRTRPRLGEARRDAGAGDRHTSSVLARSGSRTRCANHSEGENLSGRLRSLRPRNQDHEAGGRDEILPRAHSPRRGHHLRHR